MIYERYTASGVNTLSYGYTFKNYSGDEDSLFDLEIGNFPQPSRINPGEMEVGWMQYEKYAKAICEQGPP